MDNNHNWAVVKALETIKEKVTLDKHGLILQLFNKRQGKEILESGFSTGCTDDAVAFMYVLETLGQNYQYVETLEKDWLESPMENSKIRGHAYVEVDGYLVDPQRKAIYLDPSWVLSRYVVFGKAKSPWDLGLNSFQEMVQIFMNYKENHQKGLVKTQG
jgi:hypothetical protein